ncbi:MAG: response regulator, partial [Eudoraea sp.]|nr:response regulator [Eudoraea sp.]
YIGSNNGFYSFPADQTFSNPYPPQLAISDILISDKNYFSEENRSSELDFSHNQNDIAFKYIALHYSNPEKNSYKYKLEPLDDEWINAGYERIVRYAKLPPGSYNFQVKASNRDGIWSDETASAQFTIQPPWWTTWWAYVLYVMALVFITERFYRFRLSKKLADSESKRLKEVDQLKNALFTNITHEFRTPLTVIKGMTDTIKSKLEDRQFDELDNSLSIIDRNSDGLLNLINEMLDLAKIESGNMELNLVQANIIPYIKYLTQSFDSLAEGKEINFTVHCDLEELKMDLDVNKFTAIVTNLLSNAIKFTSNKGVVSVHIDKIQLDNTDFLTLMVKDSGLGISREEQEHIFDKFYQVDDSSSRLQKGTGIGLSLVREFVELMKGVITVESEQGKGSAFNIRIPITNKASIAEVEDLFSVSSISKSTRIPSVKEEPISSEITDKDLPMVLIIEDNPDVAHYIKTCLKENHHILYAADGASGIEMALEKIPDIIISDVMMPEKDGFEVCERIKTDELTDHIPIIMLTARASFEDRLTGLSHGADAYLTKPFEKAELLTRIDQLVRLRKKMLSKFEKTGIDRLLTQNVKNRETKFLDKIITLIHDHITEADFGAVQLAQKLHFSESQLYRKLKATSGKSTALFIRSIRLQKAREFILTTDRTVSEIAYDVGFNDPSYFSRVYKDEFGHAPSSKS